MTNIIDYIKWRGDLSFSIDPLNVVDNLIFSQFSYMSFASLLTPDISLSIQELTPLYLDSMKDKKQLGLFLRDKFFTLLEHMGKSKRFGELQVKEYVEITDIEKDIQFCAMVIELSPTSAYIVFRGTDDTVVGWKEDLMMSFLDEIPAQKEALAYVMRIATTYNYEELYIGGHSKGGNLAVYAAVQADEKVKANIQNVFNNDGPGFRQRIVDTDVYRTMSHKIITLVPKSSVVGLLLEHEESYLVVNSNRFGIRQHDGFSWEVMGTDFVYLPSIDKDALKIAKTMQDTLETLDLEQREKAITVLFDIFTANDATTLLEIKNHSIKNFYAMSKTFSELDKETKAIITSIIGTFFDNGVKNFFDFKLPRPIGNILPSKS